MTFQANFRNQLDRVPTKTYGEVFCGVLDLSGAPTGAERDPNFGFFFLPRRAGKHFWGVIRGREIEAQLTASSDFV